MQIQRGAWHRRLRVVGPRWVSLVVVFSLFGAIAAWAAAGDLDPSFGGTGQIRSDILGSDDGMYGMALQSDGKIIAVGKAFNEGGSPCAVAVPLSSGCGNSNYDWGLARYNADGTLDAGFGIGGREAIAWSSVNGGDNQAKAVSVKSDGSIVVVGGILGYAGMALFNPDGTLAAPPIEVNAPQPDIGGEFEAVAVQTDGKLVAAGANASQTSFLIARINADGTLDTGFGNGGTVVESFPGSLAVATSMAIQTDGKIIVGGYADYGSTGSDVRFVVARYTPNGTLDATFGTNGVANTSLGGYSEVKAITLQADGRIVVAGMAAGTIALARYTSNGQLDTSFNGTGSLLSRGGEGDAVAVQSNGKIIAVGTSAPDLVAERFNGDGTPDSGFGSGGATILTYPQGSSFLGLQGSSVVVQSDGKIVTGGRVNDPIAPPGSDFYIGRLMGDTPPAGPDLSVSITDTPDPVTVRQALTYSVSVTNLGGAGTAPVSMGDSLPKNVALNSVTTTAGSCKAKGAMLSCTLPALAAGATSTVTVTVKPRKAGTIASSASVSTAGDTNSANNTAYATTTVSP